jgi:FkbM family methyltransferase
MASTRKRWNAVFFTAAALLLFVAGTAAVNYLKRPPEYRRTLARLIPRFPPFVLSVRDIQERNIDFIIDFYGLRYRGNTSYAIDAHIYLYGAYEKPELFFLRNTLSSIGPDAVFVDVGANTGQYSLFASLYSSEVHAIEPYPPLVSRLKSMVVDNNLGNIVVHPVGLGEGEAAVPFYSPPEGNLATGSFVEGFFTNLDENLTLQIVSGDEYFPQVGIGQVDCIKMDIEAFEKPALAGLQRTLRSQRPILLLELTADPSLEETFKSLQEFRSAFPDNYDFFVLTNKDLRSGAYRLRRSNPAFNRKRQYNIVACPSEKLKNLTMVFDGHSAGQP